jgi:adenine-specific DNA-methyltransferase
MGRSISGTAGGRDHRCSWVAAEFMLQGEGSGDTVHVAPGLSRGATGSDVRFPPMESPMRTPAVSSNASTSRVCESYHSPSLTRIASLSYGAHRTGNALIKGDNLHVLPFLEEKLKGKVRCVYIDPPYNNRDNYTHYRDDLDHETWLRAISLRLEKLHPLLSSDGSIWMSIDDGEVHYLKVAADKVFGRENFVCTVVWQHRKSRENRRVFSLNHEYILVYAKDHGCFRHSRNLLELTTEIKNRYRNPDHDPRGPWQSISANVQAGHATPSQFYEIRSPSGVRHRPPKGRCWAYTKERFQAEIAANNVWFGTDGKGVPRIKKFMTRGSGITPESLWLADEVGTTNSAKKHVLELFPDHAVFDTPKPEELIYRILSIATRAGDVILDAYLGSGTTAAVAHKMGRKYIGIEQGEHAITHCSYRLRQVIDGERSGVSNLTGWKGGGGYEFFELK